MSKHHVLGCTLVVTALVGLGCAGMGSGEGGGLGGSKDSKADTKRLLVAASDITRAGKGEKAPGKGVADRARRKDMYVVKLAPGVDSLDLAGGGLRTGRPGADSVLGRLALQESRRVHDGDAPKRKEIAEQLGLGRTIRIRSNKPQDEVVQLLESLPEVDWVEPVSEMRNAGAPNDPYWQYQWHMQALHVDQAWRVTQGEGVVVAVVDTGVSANEDGFFRLLQGKDFVDGDNKPNDENGHGSHVAGTIGQATNNGVGVAGVAPKVSILPVRVLDANGSGDNTTVAQGIIWAVDHGANIINLSLGSSMNSEAVSDAVAYAYENDVTVVAATGNDGYTDFVGFPAALETPIAVGAVDFKNNVTYYSNQGREIDIVGPGGDSSADLNGDGQQDGVLQETPYGGQWAFQWLQGTSMASPHVAGCAALVYANGVHDPDQIKKVLTQSAQDLGARGWDSTYGWGLVDPVAALDSRAPRSARGDGPGDGKFAKGDGPGRGGDGPGRPGDGPGREGPGKARGKAGGPPGGGRERGEGGGGGGLEISGVRVQKAGQTRAVINWLTNEPARTAVKGEGDGFQRSDESLTKVHSVVVHGQAGKTVQYTIVSSKGGDERATEQVTVQF